MPTKPSPIATLHLTSPLFTAWHTQYVKLTVPGLLVGHCAHLLLDGQETPFQYTGRQDDTGAEVLLYLGFAVGQHRTLAFYPAEFCATILQPHRYDLTDPVQIGPPGRTLTIHPILHADGAIGGPLGDYAGFPLTSRVTSTLLLQDVTLMRTNVGPLYTEYQLRYRYPDNAHYTITYLFYHDEPLLGIGEIFLLGMDAQLIAEINPAGVFTHLVSHTTFDFEADNAPVVDQLGIARPKELLCRLQMPVLGEYTVPNNRGWFAFYNETHHERGLFGLLGLYGDHWRRPVDNIMQLHDHAGHVTLTAALAEGERHWMLVTGPLETTLPEDHLYLFNRLHGSFNALRLDAHLDLTGKAAFDSSVLAPGFFGTDVTALARENLRQSVLLQQAQAAGDPLLAVLGAVSDIDPTPARTAMRDALFARCARWVAQFQGYRFAQNDYNKTVIGFTRTLRMLMLHYEALCQTGFLTDAEIRRLHAYFTFAARRIMDEGRWPHSKTTLHPWHPDSTRRLYAYPGEHEPDRLYWTNCLPNFQSDPLCALIHVACLLPDHPDTVHWLRKGLEDLDGQLTAYCGASGAWEESINYALFTLSYFLTTFRVLKQRLGIDYFQDTRVRRYVDWLTRFVAGYDKRFDAVTWPPIGNSRLPQNQAAPLLLYAQELADNDPLREACLAVFQQMAPRMTISAYEVPFFLTAPLPAFAHPYVMPSLRSEKMDEVGVALRHEAGGVTPSFLFQKIGFAKDHYEGDESAFTWYAKGTPLCMDYGTYTGDVGAQAAHNLIEIPDEDNLRRGYLSDAFFSEAADFTRAEMPVVLKLSYGKVRSFAEIDGPPRQPLYFYIGDENPVGPRAWKRRLLLYVKPDYLLLFDRVFAAVPHRFNLHTVSNEITRQDATIICRGRYDQDLLCFVQHPVHFRLEQGELAPAPQLFGDGEDNPHRQRYFRLYNDHDGIYRTVLFAREQGREVVITSCGATGVCVTTPEYTDYAFASDENIDFHAGNVRFGGRVGWIRRSASGVISAIMPDGDLLEAFGVRLAGRGPWSYTSDRAVPLDIRGTPRRVTVEE